MSSIDLERRASGIVEQAYKVVEGFMCDKRHKDIVDRVFEQIIEKNTAINKTITTSAGRKLMNNVKDVKDNLCSSIRHEILGNTPFRKELIDTAVKILREKNSTEEALKAVRERIASYLFETPIAPRGSVKNTYLDALANTFKYDLVDTGLVTYKELIDRLSAYANNPIVEYLIILLSELEIEVTPTRPISRREKEETEEVTEVPTAPTVQAQPGNCFLVKDYLVLSNRENPGISPRELAEEILRGLPPKGLVELYQQYSLNLLKESDIQVLRNIPAVASLPKPEEEVIHPGFPSACGLELYGVFNRDIEDYAIYTTPTTLKCLKVFAESEVKEGRFPITKLELFDSFSSRYRRDEKLKLPHTVYVYLAGVDVHQFGNALADLIVVEDNSEIRDYLRALAWGLVYDFYTVSRCVRSAI